MPRYRWTGNGVYHDHRHSREVDPGETVDLPAHVGGPHPELVPVDDDADAGVDAPFDPNELTVGDLRNRVADAELTPAERDALIDAEMAGKDRATALDALGE